MISGRTETSGIEALDFVSAPISSTAPTPRQGIRPVLESKILIVDDYREMVAILRRMLLQFGFKDVDDASDGPSALVKLRTHPYDLVLADIIMEPMDGMDLLQRIREATELRSIPFIMVTAVADERQIIAARNAGVAGYILKPFTAEDLKKRIAAVLGEFSADNSLLTRTRPKLNVTKAVGVVGR